MDEKELQKAMEEVSSTVEAALEKGLNEFKDEVVDEAKTVASKEAEKAAKEFAKRMAAERLAYGKDSTGLDESQKAQIALAAIELSGVKANTAGELREKAGEELNTVVDSRGGYLVPKETANAIAYIAKQTGLVTRLGAQYWPMQSEKLEVPAYSGNLLEWQFYTEDINNDRQEVAVQSIAFDAALLDAKDGQLPFALTKSLLRNANVNVADFLLYLAGASFANTVDKQALVGAGSPFTGVVNTTGVAAVTLPTGSTTYAAIASNIDKLHEAVATLDESARDGSAFVMHSSVWHEIVVNAKNSNGDPLINLDAQSGAILQYKQATGLTPAGFIYGYPVFTNRNMPSTADATQANKPFVIFGNFVGVAYGMRDNLAMNKYESGVWAGRELSLTGRVGLSFEATAAIAVAIKDAFAVIKTAAI